MKFSYKFKRRLFVSFVVLFVIAGLNLIQTLAFSPDRLVLYQGQEYVYSFGNSLLLSLKARGSAINLGSANPSLYNHSSNPESGIPLKAESKGTTSLSISAFGFIPLKTIQVDVLPDKKVMVCGNTVGVKLMIDGLLVVGMSKIDTIENGTAFPSKESGIKIGDRIMKANDATLSYTNDLIKLVEASNGKPLKLQINRNDTTITTTITPVKSMDNKKYHLGLWLRDSTAGIGTLTFFDPETRCFGALGHGITDIDAKVTVPVRSGEIVEANILAIKKGTHGSPGEIKGVFSDNRNRLGTLEKNCEFGIYGSLDGLIPKITPYGEYSIALKNQVVEGPAKIISTVDGKSAVEYSVEIQKISRQGLSNQKGMVIKVTDPRLLDTTGGIVQGMSGSPIIQNGRLVGAVTHVLVNDPTKGYGVFIEWMIKNMSRGENASIFERSA